MKKKLATVMAATMAVSGSVVSVNAATTEDKIVGSNRTDTAVRISKEGWKSAETVILVNDSAIPDALTATPLAHAKNAPILLTGKNGLNKVTADEIKRLGAKDVIMIGGDAVLSAKVEKDLKALNVKVDRIKGSTREETALAIAKRLDGIKDVSEIAVVNGTTGLADAVSVAAAAAERNMPILLANPKKGLSVAEKFIKDEAIKASFVIGGKTALPEKLVSSLPGKQRIEGSNRNNTNAKVIEKFYTGKELNNVYLAKDGMGDSGQLIDALAVGALAAKNGAPVLIASKKLSAAQVDVINTKKIDTITQVGGKGNEGAFNQLKDIEETDVYEVGTVEELKEALEKANANDKIVLKPNATITEDIIISTDKNVDIKVEGTVTGKVEITAPNGNVANNSTSKPETNKPSGGGSTGGTITPPSENKFEITLRTEDYDLTPLHLEVNAIDGVNLKLVEKEGNKDVTNDFIKGITNDPDSDIYEITLKKPLLKDVVYQIVAEKGSNTAKVEISTKKDFVYVPVSEKEKLYNIDQFAGKTVVLDGTDYELTKQIKVTKPLEIMGDFDYDVEKPVLKASGTWTATGKGDASIILVSDTKGVKLTNIDVTGAKDVNYTDNGKAKTAYGIGINLFKSEVYLNNVASYNNAGAGFVVNGSTLTGEGVITTGNKWGGINIDKGDGVTNQCVVKLTHANLEETLPIYSDSNDEEYLKDIIVEVKDEGEDDYLKDTVSYSNGTKITAWSTYKLPTYLVKNAEELKEAIGKAESGDEIKLKPGTYVVGKEDSTGKENFVIEKEGITISGTDDGETIIEPKVKENGAQRHQATIIVLADNVSLSGLTVGEHTNKCVEVYGNNVDIGFCNIKGNLYFNGSNIEKYNIYNNTLESISITNGTGIKGDKAKRIIEVNTININPNRYGFGIGFTGKRNSGWDTETVGEATIKNNYIKGDAGHIRLAGELNIETDDIVANNNFEDSKENDIKSKLKEQSTTGSYGEIVKYITYLEVK